MKSVVKEEELHTTGTASLSKAGARYVRTAKTAGGSVFAAIDTYPDGKNCVKTSCMVNFMGLAKEGSRELGVAILAGYIACATSYSPSLNDALDTDLSEAMDLLYKNFMLNKESIDRRRDEVESNADLIRELTRRAANKPKE